jgi:hypothetical protein
VKRNSCLTPAQIEEQQRRLQQLEESRQTRPADVNRQF